MRRGYIRLSKAGPSLRAQQDALRKAGIEDFGKGGHVYVDRAEDAGLPQRRQAVESLRPGDDLVIATASRLGNTQREALAVLEQIGERGATLVVAESNSSVTWHPEAAIAIAFAIEAEQQARNEVAAAMRRRKAEVGARSGPEPKLTGRAAARAEKIWKDPDISGVEAAAKIGMSVASLHRMFGPRGTPRFGRKKS